MKTSCLSAEMSPLDCVANEDGFTEELKVPGYGKFAGLSASFYRCQSVFTDAVLCTWLHRSVHNSVHKTDFCLPLVFLSWFSVYNTNTDNIREHPHLFQSIIYFSTTTFPPFLFPMNKHRQTPGSLLFFWKWLFLWKNEIISTISVLTDTLQRHAGSS